MISFAFKINDEIKTGVQVSDDIEKLKYNIPKNCKFWNLNLTPIDTINEDNAAGVGVSEFHLKVEEDEKNL